MCSRALRAEPGANLPACSGARSGSCSPPSPPGSRSIAVFSALEGGRAWVIALAAGALALWLADLARRALAVAA